MKTRWSVILKEVAEWKVGISKHWAVVGPVPIPALLPQFAASKRRVPSNLRIPRSYRYDAIQLHTLEFSINKAVEWIVGVNLWCYQCCPIIALKTSSYYFLTEGFLCNISMSRQVMQNECFSRIWCTTQYIINLQA